LSGDLEDLLEREETALAVGKERQHQQAQGPKADLGGEFNLPKESNSKSSSRSGSDNDETEWQSQSGGENEDDELEDSQLISVRTVAGAEDHLVNHLDHIAYAFPHLYTQQSPFFFPFSEGSFIGTGYRRLDISDEQLNRMNKLMAVNCLHRGDISNSKGKRWMVAVDGSEASQRAFQGVLKLMDRSEDHLFVVCVRNKNLPRRFALRPSEEVQLHFQLWKSTREIVKPFADQLLAGGLAASHFTVLIPDAWDARRILCNLAKQYDVSTLCVGKHSKSERNRHQRNMRSLHAYTSNKAHCQVIVF
jgi:nucleotide-binding universal stress UspA family protein